MNENVETLTNEIKYPCLMQYCGGLNEFKNLIVLFTSEECGTVLAPLRCKGLLMSYRLGQYEINWQIHLFKQLPSDTKVTLSN